MCQTHTRRQFVRKVGAAASALGALKAAPAETGELWQWHTVTRNFEEFVAGNREYCRKQLGFVWVGELCN